MTYLLAIFLGGLFGVALQKVGATNPQNIINMLRLTDLHLMKAILLAIGASSLALFIGMALGWIDGGHLSIKSSYVGVIVGGAILGAGWAIAGYCPGTGLGAMAEGRGDALWFVLGGLAGALVFALIFAAIADTGLFSTLGGAVTVARTEGNPALVTGVPGVVVAGVIAVVFIAVAVVLPRYPGTAQRAVGGQSGVQPH